MFLVYKSKIGYNSVDLSAQGNEPCMVEKSWHRGIKAYFMIKRDDGVRIRNSIGERTSIQNNVKLRPDKSVNSGETTNGRTT